jgi:ribosomal protein S6
MLECAHNMAEDMAVSNVETSENEVVTRIYEVGYHIIPTVAEDQVEKIVGDIRAAIEKAGGSFIAEGAPALTRLAYEMDAREGEKNIGHERAYFGWLKFEAPVAAAQVLDTALQQNQQILRHIVFQTVREETRARMKAPTLREVKRTDTIKTTPRREEEAGAPVSEEDLDKALQDITQD